MQNSNKTSALNYYITIGLIIAEIITVLTPFFILGQYFDFPDILRKPAAEAFALFRQNQHIIVPAYYTFMISGLLFLPMTYWLATTLQTNYNKLSQNLLLGLGISTALFQAIGFCRWVFLMPFLTMQFFQHPENQDTIALVYETMNRYAGMTIGEHLGFIAMGFWTITLGVLLYQHAGFKKWVGVMGVIIGGLIITSVMEHFGGSSAAFFAALNVLANVLWIFWLIVVSFFLFFQQKNEFYPEARRTAAVHQEYL